LSDVARFFSTQNGVFYRPIIRLVFYINWLLWGGNSFGYHLFSLIIHLFNITFVYYLSYKIYFKKSLTLITTTVFSLYVLNSGSILWFANISGLISTFFGLIALVSWIYYLQSLKDIYRYITLLAYLTALLSKENVIILSLLLLLIEWYFSTNLKISAIKYKQYLLFFLPIIIYMGLRLIFEIPWSGDGYEYRFGLNLVANVMGYLVMLVLGSFYNVEIQNSIIRWVVLGDIQWPYEVALVLSTLIIWIVIFFLRDKKYFSRNIKKDMKFIILGGFIVLIPFLPLEGISDRYVYFQVFFGGLGVP